MRVLPICFLLVVGLSFSANAMATQSVISKLKSFCRSFVTTDTNADFVRWLQKIGPVTTLGKTKAGRLFYDPSSAAFDMQQARETAEWFEKNPEKLADLKRYLARLTPDVISKIADVIENPEKFGKPTTAWVLLVRAAGNGIAQAHGVPALPLIKMVERYADRNKLPTIHSYLLNLGLFDILVRNMMMTLQSAPYFRGKFAEPIESLEDARAEVGFGIRDRYRRLLDRDIDTGFRYSLSSDYNIARIQLQKFTDQSEHIAILLDLIADLDILVAMSDSR